MDTFDKLTHPSKKRDRDDASDTPIFPSPKRVDHSADRSRSDADAPTARKEFTARSLSPDGGVAVDEVSLAKYRSYRHIVLSDKSSRDDRPSQKDQNGSKQVAKPLQRRQGSFQPHTSHQSGPDHQHITNYNQRVIPPYASSLPVFSHNRGTHVAEPGSSSVVYQAYRGLEFAQPLDSVVLNPRIGMAVEGGKLYLAQTLHHYYRKHIYCPQHGSIDGKPGHNRAVMKVHETGRVHRMWFCTSQPKGQGHRLDNTEYIELAKEQLDRALFDRILCELIRQLHDKDCQPVGRNRMPQSDDFDYFALLQYIDSQGLALAVFNKRLAD
ncbi:hypothetical protein E4T48_00889 [Aureobasidium sp. EXF-10727]|nr:hypothetical protein E4T48_00889 [Aureobasidium sp. EXF-10727]